MTARTPARASVAWTVAAASVVGLAANEILGRTWDVSDEGEFPLFVAAFVGTVAMGVVGALVTSRTRNPIGWILLAIPAGVTVSLLADTLTKHGATRSPVYLELASWLSTWPFLVALVLPVAIFYLFPSGTIPSPRWRWPWWIYVATAIVTVVGFAVQPGSQRPVDGAPPVANPFGIDALEPALGLVLAFAGMTLVLSAFSSFASLVVRYRAAGSEERQQLRWLFAVGAVGVIVIVALLTTVIASGDADEGLAATVTDVLVLLLTVDVAVGIPVATGVAIFRYRLWDLNIVVRRTVLVATMALAITVLYVGIVVAVPLLVGARGGGVDALPLVAAATVAIAFDPLRRGARRLADRIVYGQRATPYEVLTAFGERVEETYSTDDVLPRMAEVLARGTGADRCSVWLQLGNELRREATWPSDARPAVGVVPARGDVPPTVEGEHLFEVRQHGELLGALSLAMPPSEPIDPVKEQLARDLAAQGGLLLRNVRLIEELRASRQRLVAAQDEERRRLERNLHDGVQQQMVALTVQLRLVDGFIDRDPTKARTLVQELQVRTTDALEDLRDLARGIYPPLLADKGLAAALEAQARKAPLPVTVSPDGVGRYPQDVEAAVYFSCLEALNNIAKYADASSATVTLADGGDALTFSVTDDGRGFDAAATSYGTGLQGIADRLDAIGGRIAVDSCPGGGTTITGSIPRPGGAP